MQEAQQPRNTGPFGLDPDVIAEIEKDWIKCDNMKQTQFAPIDLSFMEQPIRIIPNNGVQYPAERLQILLSNSSTRPQSANATLYHNKSPSHPNIVSAAPVMQRPATANPAQ